MSKQDAQSDSKNKNEKIIKLPGGGTIVSTKLGHIQFGIPPETIKDSMSLKIRVPTIFVLPDDLFNRELGVNVAEAEFPAYYNYFLHGRRVNFIATKDQENRLRRVFRETLLGPEEIDLAAEFSPEISPEFYPDLKKESQYIRTFASIDELMYFTLFTAVDGSGDIMEAVLPENIIIRKQKNSFFVLEDGQLIAEVPTLVDFSLARFERRISTAKAFEPPLFGITVLGSSNGFDPEHKTTGFVLWMNRRGIMVDPPLYSRELLEKKGVPSRLIDFVIVSHCHADHDGGVIQKVLEESQVTVITTPTIINSFVRKYAALAGMEEDLLRSLFVFRPALIGEALRLLGGELRFFYTLHTIPAIGFEAYYGGQSIYFSGDTCYDPDRFQDMYQKGFITKQRRDFFVNFTWHHNVILHEAGVPPIHTPISVLEKLPDDVKKRLYLVHTSEKSIPQNKGLRVAEEGVQKSIILNASPHSNWEAIEILRLLSSIEIFHHFNLNQACEVLQIAHRHRYAENAVIIQQDTVGEAFYIIISGIVTVYTADWNKNLISGDFFGEMSLFTGALRSATVVARTEVEVISFKKYDFLSLLRGSTELVTYLHSLSEMRREKTWEVINANSVLVRMTNSQKTQIQSKLVKEEIKEGCALWKAGEIAESCFLIDSGEFKFVGLQLPRFHYGTFLGEVNAVIYEEKLTTTVIAIKNSTAYRISRKELVEFFDRNPGIKMSFLNTKFVDALKSPALAESHTSDLCIY